VPQISSLIEHLHEYVAVIRSHHSFLSQTKASTHGNVCSTGFASAEDEEEIIEQFDEKYKLNLPCNQSLILNSHAEDKAAQH
jgi:hypothetical protein